jgi:hypothetical protein
MLGRWSASVIETPPRPLNRQETAMKKLILPVAALIAALSLFIAPGVADAQRAGHTYAGRGYAGTPPPPSPGSGGYRGGPPAQGGHYAGGGYRGYYAGGYPGRYGYGYGYRPYAPYWRAGWGWGGWGWGVGWYPGWYGYAPGYWGWSVGAPIVVTPSVSGAWVLPPSASTVYIEKDAEAQTGSVPSQPAQQQWWYWCASSHAYYPYVETCTEGWQRVEPRKPPGAQ